MSATPLAIDLLANALGAVLYFAVARLVASRPVDADAVTARRAFTWWWYALGLLALYGGVADLVTLEGLWTVPLMVAATHVLLLEILLALAGLLYYLVYLYTGRAEAWKPILVAYMLFWAVLVYWVEALRPDGLQPGPITPRLHFVHDPQRGPVAFALGLLLLLPVIGAAVGYFTLYFKAREPTQRYRIAVVSMSILLWFSFSLVGSLAGVTQSLAWLVVSRVVSLGAAAGVYAAYRPPRWVQRRWGVRGLAVPQ